MTEPQSSGADLARQMLRRAQADARNRPTGPAKRKPTRRRAERGAGRDPLKFDGILEHLADTYGWRRPSAAGLITARWPQLMPHLAQHAIPERYDTDTRTLHLRPANPAAATKLRWEATAIAAALNAAVGTDTVAAVKVLSPGPSRADRPGPAEAAEPAEHRDEPAPVRTRDDAAPGYHQARAAISRETPAGQKPRLQRDWGTGDFAWLREDEEAFTDGQAALESTAASSGGNNPDAVRQAAIRMARTERAGRAPAVPTVFQRTA
ncbi:DciA family protein [Streptomyces antimycoticus]|uniref:DciA family protein n=1 Tax=Streptomyces antimycoticus TaxID=68175 RepID=UPI003678E9FB